MGKKRPSQGRKIHKKIIGFPTVIMGNSSQAIQLYKDIENQEI